VGPAAMPCWYITTARQTGVWPSIQTGSQRGVKGRGREPPQAFLGPQRSDVMQAGSAGRPRRPAGPRTVIHVNQAGGLLSLGGGVEACVARQAFRSLRRRRSHAARVLRAWRRFYDHDLRLGCRMLLFRLLLGRSAHRSRRTRSFEAGTASQTAYNAAHHLQEVRLLVRGRSLGAGGLLIAGSCRARHGAHGGCSQQRGGAGEPEGAQLQRAVDQGQ